MNMGWKHDSRQPKKFVFWLSMYNLSVLNMVSKHDSRQPKKNRKLGLDLQPLCADYWLET